MLAFFIALLEFGNKGIVGGAHNKEVLKYFHETEFEWVKDDETAWCAAFVNWVIMRTGQPGTKSLAARSFLKFGQKASKPQIGCLVVLWRINRDGPYGHVGFYLKETADSIYILGGNQSNEVNIKAFPKTQLLEYRTF